MVSVENLYWILSSNLLGPCKLDCWYYYPFGTKENLSRNQFSPFVRQGPIAFFHFDQEPIWNDHFGSLYDTDAYFHAFTGKVLKLLANSEKSQIKTQICRDRYMQDWYFFYHGLAALDWFRDAQYIDTNTDITNSFLSFNHLVTSKRSYRMALISRLSQMEILHKGAVSCHGNINDFYDEINAEDSLLSKQSKTLIHDYLDKSPILPKIIDRADIIGSCSAHFGYHEYHLWQQSFLHLVNETVFYDNKLHLTEKIFKPIVSLRPFVLVAAPGNLQYLKDYGFKTFDRYWNESYDQIQDMDERLDAIAQIVFAICNWSSNKLRDVLADMHEILQYNKKHFFNSFKTMVINELVDNFDSCVRTWNNGRVDSRSVPNHPDLASVKKILLR